MTCADARGGRLLLLILFVSSGLSLLRLCFRYRSLQGRVKLNIFYHDSHYLKHFSSTSSGDTQCHGSHPLHQKETLLATRGGMIEMAEHREAILVFLED